MRGNRMVGGSPEPALFGACGSENEVMPGAMVATFEMRNKLPAANVPYYTILVFMKFSTN